MKKNFLCLWCNSRFDEIPSVEICPVCGHNQFGEFKWDVNFNKSAIVLKIGELSTLKSMREGHIWFQSPQYYQSYQGNEAICDIRECAFDYIFNLTPEQIIDLVPFKRGDIVSQDGKELELVEILNCQYGIVSPMQNSYRLLCFYTLYIDKSDNSLFDVDERLKSFGSSFSMINLGQMTSLIAKKLNQANIYSIGSGVKYATKNYSGAYNPTYKDYSFEYQHEYRMITQSVTFLGMDKMDPYKIQIDPLAAQEAISEPYPIDILYSANDASELQVNVRCLR